MNEFRVRLKSIIDLTDFVSYAKKMGGVCYLRQNLMVVNAQSLNAALSLNLSESMIFTYDAFDEGIAEKLHDTYGISSKEDSLWYKQQCEVCNGTI